MNNKEFFSTSEVAKILGISRVAVFNRIKKGKILATKIGRNFVIPKSEIESVLGRELSEKDKKIISEGVKKVLEEYGETLKKLGKE
jgi:excisionase family DNA binding protein